MIDLLVFAMFLLFVTSQSLYFVVNLFVDILLYPRRVNLVTEAETDPADRPQINVLLPVYGESRALVQETIEHLHSLSYPAELVNVHLVYEPDDEAVSGYVDSLEADAALDGFGFNAIPVNRESLLWNDRHGEVFTGEDIPRTKASALNYAFLTQTFHPDSVVTVFDSDTRVPDDLFELAVSGLESYDVVQAKQTVRNLDDGWLPRLEAMGMAAWSHVVYPKTSLGPYQLLGKAYFIRTRDLYALDAWDAEEVTEDMALGIAAHTEGYSLGILDRYVQDLCPATLDEWTTQKTRWMSGPYRVLLSRDLSTPDRVRFAAFTVSNQMMSAVNLVGIPAGVAVLVLELTVGQRFPLAVTLLVLFNLVNWAYYSVRSYEAATAAIPFETRRERLRYYLISNPLTQAVYATLWAIPIATALTTWASGRAVTFEVTEKDDGGPHKGPGSSRDDGDPFAELRPDDLSEGESEEHELEESSPVVETSD